MGGHLNIILDESGSMQELGKLVLACQVIEDLKAFFEVDLVGKNGPFDTPTLWITDGYDNMIDKNIIILLVGCDHSSYRKNKDNTYTMEEFPLMIEKLKMF